MLGRYKSFNWYAGSTLVHQGVLAVLASVGLLAMLPLAPLLDQSLVPVAMIWTLAAVLPVLQLREFARSFEDGTL